jgi:hypothetical protein
MVGSQGASRRMFYWVVATRHEGTTLRQSVVLLYLFCVAQYILFKYYMLIRPWYLLVIPWLAFPLFSFPCVGLIETVAFFVFFDSVQMLKQLRYFRKNADVMSLNFLFHVCSAISTKDSCPGTYHACYVKP